MCAFWPGGIQYCWTCGLCADLLEASGVAVGEVDVVHHLEASIGDVVVVAVEARVPVEAGDHDEHGQNEHDDSLRRQVRQLLPHPAALRVWVPPARPTAVRASQPPAKC